MGTLHDPNAESGSTYKEPVAAEDELEDDVPTLIEYLCDDAIHCDDSAALKQQLRDALEKLIDERIEYAKR